MSGKGTPTAVPGSDPLANRGIREQGERIHSTGFHDQDCVTPRERWLPGQTGAKQREGRVLKIFGEKA